MIRYTTPVIPIQVEGADLSSYDSIHVTFEQTGVKIDKINPAIQNDTLLVSLTQEESGMLRRQQLCKVMVNAWKDGRRFGSEIMTLNVQENLLDEVMLE